MNDKTHTFAPVKPARSYEEQAQRLVKSHGLEIGDARRARRILSTVNYYRLTTYGKHLRRQDNPELFLPGVSLEDLAALYEFDMGLRHQILPVLELFEVQLRAKISYHLAMTYGSTGYTEAKNFRPEKPFQGSHRDIMNKFRTEVRRCDDLAFVRHHQKKYGGKFPVWAAVELFSFGMLAQLYDVMTERDQRAVSGEYGMEPQALASLIGCAVDVRNICAHYSRLYNQPIEELPVLPEAYAHHATDRVFALLLALRPAVGDCRAYAQMIRGIAQLEKEYPQAELALCGFPENWEELLENE